MFQNKYDSETSFCNKHCIELSLSYQFRTLFTYGSENQKTGFSIPVFYHQAQSKHMRGPIVHVAFVRFRATPHPAEYLIARRKKRVVTFKNSNSNSDSGAICSPRQRAAHASTSRSHPLLLYLPSSSEHGYNNHHLSATRSRSAASARCRPSKTSSTLRSPCIAPSCRTTLLRRHFQPSPRPP